MRPIITGSRATSSAVLKRIGFSEIERFDLKGTISLQPTAEFASAPLGSRPEPSRQPNA